MPNETNLEKVREMVEKVAEQLFHYETDIKEVYLGNFTELKGNKDDYNYVLLQAIDLLSTMPELAITIPCDRCDKTGTVINSIPNPNSNTPSPKFQVVCPKCRGDGFIEVILLAPYLAELKKEIEGK